MKNDFKNMYKIGGFTALLGGLLMVFSFYWFTFRKEETFPIMHGISIVQLVMIVPTIVATTLLLINDVKTWVLLGLGFAVLWIAIEIIAHCSQTAPLNQLKEIIGDTTSEEHGKTLKELWDEWSEALTLIGAFLYSVSAICFGVSLRKWGNTVSMFLFLISAIVFGLTFIPGVSFNWHILSRGLAFVFLGGVLLLATRGMIDEEWGI